MIKIQSRPEIDAPDVLEGVRAHYGLDGSLSPLPGDRDRNFLLSTDEGHRYVVKVSSPDESDEILEIEADLMEHLDRSTDGFAAGIRRSTDDRRIVKHTDSHGREHRLRVVDYLEGGLFADVRVPLPARGPGTASRRAGQRPRSLP